MTATLDDFKRQAAEEAANLVTSGMVVGLGTGSTAVHLVRALGRRLQDGRLRDILGVPTSERTAAEARRYGIPLATLLEHPEVALTVDGADEIDPDLNLIKGLGGALLREKIVASASRQLIIIGDHTKSVARLGSQAPVPVEVVPFAQAPVAHYLQGLGGRVVLRATQGQPFQTDENNIILDCYFGPIDDAHALALNIISRPGVVEHGLFLDMATEVILAGPQGLDMRKRTPIN